MTKHKSILFPIVIVIIVIVLAICLFISFGSNNNVSSTEHSSNVEAKTISRRTNRIIHKRIHTNFKQHGELVAPSCHVHLPVLNGTGQDMMKGAGKYGNRKMGHGNYVLFSHHMRSNSVLFSPLYRHARKSTKIYLTNFRHTYVYKIYSRRVIPETDVRVVNNTRKPIISLITCTKTLGGSNRLLLRGKLVKRYKFNHTPKHVIRAMMKRTNNRNVLAGY